MKHVNAFPLSQLGDALKGLGVKEYAKIAQIINDRFTNFEPGRTDLGEFIPTMFANSDLNAGLKSEGQRGDKAHYEVHCDFIDVQIVLGHNEIIYLRELELEGCKEVVPYKPDIAFYDGTAEATVAVHLTPGTFYVIGTEWLHMPLMEDPDAGVPGEDDPIRKIIIKVPVRR